MKDYYMTLAIKEAKKAKYKKEIPVGTVIVLNDKIIAKSHNIKEKKRCCVYHAEINAIMKASKKLKDWRLKDCIMYVTLEPCPMCMSAIKQARIKEVIYGASSDANITNLNSKIIETIDSNSTIKITKNVCKKKCEELIINFFKHQRN